MGHAGHDGGRQEVAVQRAVAAQDDFGPFGGRVIDVFFDLLTGCRVDQRAEVYTCLKAVTDFHGLDPRFELGGEGVIDARLHVDAVGADAGLAVVAELAEDGPFHSCVQIGVVEDDEGGVAAQFHGAFHHLIRCLAQQDAAHFGGASERELAHGRVFAEFLADGRGRR